MFFNPILHRLHPRPWRAARYIALALLFAAVSALALSAAPVSAQGTGTAIGGLSQPAHPDQPLLENLAQASIAEIEAGKTALEKSANPKVQKFAQQLIEDHSAALKDIEHLALSKRMTIPKDANMQHKATGTELKLETADTFDGQYMRKAGVNDHAQTLALLQKAQRETRDPEVKALASKLLPTMRQHLDTARQMVAQKK
ncbi:DUF4142 domain-containing protein [Polaromonas sp.]|uniref:DUF4142 domain-containing protein n=1 Tax=Polaromonas sp. TaxID=1869339 RepID=UPI0032669AF7